MSTTSRSIMYVDNNGLPTSETNDSQIFGYGTEEERPPSGTAVGDIFIVLDVGGGVYRWDVWDGSQWEPFQGNPIGSKTGTQGDILYRDATSWTTLHADTAYRFLQTQGTSQNPSWSGYKVYPSSGTDPSSPSPAAGDLYYNTGVGLWFSYDSNRLKWLSVESFSFSFGRQTQTAPGSYYKGVDGSAYSAGTGCLALWNGTIVALGYTREDTDSTTFEVTSNGSAIASLVSASLSGYSGSLNSDFSQGSILGVRNQSGGSLTTAVQGWVRVRWRKT